MKKWDVWDVSYINTKGSLSEYTDYKTLHAHSFDEISLIIQGDIKYISDNLNSHVQGKSLIFSKAYQLHNPYVEKDKPYERYQIYFKHQWLNDMIITNKMSQMDSFIISPSEEDFEELLSYMKLMHGDLNKNNETAELRRGLLLSAFFTKVIDVYQNYSINYTQITKTYINDVLAYIEKNYSKKLVAGEVAAYFFVSRTKLLSDFKQQTGMTLLNYINLIRIKNAKEYIRKGYSVTATAELCGFSNSGHFIKMFTGYNNITPLKYQKAYNMNLIE